MTRLTAAEALGYVVKYTEGDSFYGWLDYWTISWMDNFDEEA